MSVKCLLFIVKSPITQHPHHHLSLPEKEQMINNGLDIRYFCSLGSF